MAKPRSQVTDYLVYLAVRFLVCALQALSFEAARTVGRGLAWLAYRIDKRHRLAAGDNLRHAFPGRYADGEIDRLVRSVYRHFCNLLMEIIHLPRMLHPYNWRQFMELADGKVVDAMLSDQPTMLVTGHIGNWELSSYVLGLLGFRTHAIARPLDNPYLDAYLHRFREATGQKILSKHGDFERIREVLTSGGVLGTLADQDAGGRGLFVDFFGRPASTHKAVAILALEYRVTSVVIGAYKVAEPMRYRAVVEDVIRPDEYDGRPDAIKAITQRFTSGIERLARRAPEQYFWLHRRWKHQPLPRKVQRSKDEARQKEVA